MSNIPSLNSNKLIKIIKKLDFQLDHSTGSHFIFYNPSNKKRIVIPYHKLEKI